MITVDEALGALLGGAAPIADTEPVSTLEATGRVLAADQFSAVNVPPLDNTSMDGFAVRAADCGSGEARLHIAQRIPAGTIGKALAPGTAARIFTGAPIPPGADAVVIQEVCTVEGEHVVVRHKPQQGEWIRRAGEDIRAGSRILERGAKLTPQACGLAASVGLASLPVYRRLRVAVFFTGNELVMPGEKLPEGAIYNSNRFTIRGLLQQLGCEVNDLGIIPDSLAATREAFRRAAATSDLIVTSGGMSVGEEDYVKAAVEAEGEIEMWRIAVKPGKPLAFGKVGRAAFIGLPGNPVSLFVTAVVFVRPFILRCQGVSTVEPLAFPMRADFDWPKPDARREFLRVKLNGEGGLALFPNQGSAVLTSAVFADGLVDNPERQPIARGDMVRYIPLSELLG
ncbi:MAG: molybdopterin molybdotransferase MoeA [Betaproteobacteria bacterium]|nr:molybdopterin molybdotransferase MoeA [Betaproteobacteria bacterium]